MPSLLKKFVVSFCLAVFVLLGVASTPSPVKAAGEWYAPGFQDFFVKTFDPATNEIFGERYTAAQVNWIFWSIPSFFINQTLGPELATCLMKDVIPSGIISAAIPDSIEVPAEVAACFGSAAGTKFRDLIIGYDLRPEGSLLANVFSYKDPSLISSISNRLSNFHLIPEAKAQQTGFGFGALVPIRELWKTTRNISYSLLIIVVVAMSFMIMFRMKLSPQTVITVQSALPKVVVAIILVTFSYAIAGLLIDLMYVVYGLISLAGAPLLVNKDPVYAFGLLTSNSVTGGFLMNFIALALLLTVILGGLIIIVGILLSGFTAGISLLVSVVITAILFVILLVMFVKIVWMILKAYATVLFLTIASPFYAIFGALVPSFSFGTWIRNYIANLSIFVTASTLFLLSRIFLISASTKLVPFAASPFQALIPNSTPSWPPLLGGGGIIMASVLMGGVSFVLLTVIPKSAELVQSIIKGQPFNYGSAIGEAIGPGKMVGTAGLQFGVSSYEENYQKGFFQNNPNARKAPPLALAEMLRKINLVR